MFTGLIEAVGRLERIERHPGAAVLAIAAPSLAAELTVGDSVAVNGICLTVTSLSHRGFSADASGATLAKTTLGGWRPGATLNLERALRLGDRLDGHLVQGHVQGVARVAALRPWGAGRRLELVLPPELAAAAGAAVLPEGSLAVDGVSLTIADVAPDGAGGMRVAISVIPHTLKACTLGERRPGDFVNIETDQALRGLAAAAAPKSPAAPRSGGLDAARLASWGYV